MRDHRGPRIRVPHFAPRLRTARSGLPLAHSTAFALENRRNCGIARAKTRGGRVGGSEGRHGCRPLDGDRIVMSSPFHGNLEALASTSPETAVVVATMANLPAGWSTAVATTGEPIVEHDGRPL